MSIKPVIKFLVNINIKTPEKKFRLFIPLALMFLYFFIESVFDVLDFLNFISFGKIKFNTAKIKFKEYHVNKIIKISRDVLYYIVFKTGKTDLVEVDVKNKENRVFVSVKTR